MEQIKPMLCELREKPFNDPNVIWERKLDGLRILAVKKNGQTRLFSRSGKDKTAMFPEIKIETKDDCDAILDGEIEAWNFNKLQHRFRDTGVTNAVKQYPVYYEIFDIIEAKKFNLRAVVLEKRKEVLSNVLIPNDKVRIVTYVRDGLALYEIMQENSKEGIVGKRLDSYYHEGKREWYKVKCWQSGTFIVVGFTKGTGWRESTFGALILADPSLNYVGSVGTGPFLTQDNIAALHSSFSPGRCPWDREPEPAQWIKPFPVRVKYLEYTNDKKLRFPSLQEVISEVPNG